MRKVLIINPIYPKNDPVHGRPRQPLSLAWISSLLKKQNIETKLIDLPAEGKSAVDVEDLFSDYDYLITTSSTLDRWETPFLDYFEPLKLIKLYKQKNPQGFAILTGAHGTMFPERILKEHQYVDLVVLGEPEKTVHDLFSRIIYGADYLDLAGLALRRGNEVRINARPPLMDLDFLPLPNYEQLPMEKYEYLPGLLQKPFSIMETTRGCPYDCNFCFKEMHGGRNYRERGIEKVIEEINHLIEKFGVRSIYFQDLEFTIDQERTKEICRKIIKKEIKITWACASRVSDVNDELLKLMSEAGCVSISFGVESLSPKILKNINKQITIEDVKRAYEICKKYNINFNIFYTEGHLGEDKKTLEESVKNAFKLGIPHPLSRGQVIPYPGTKLCQEAVARGVMPPDVKWEDLGRWRGQVLNKYDGKKTFLTYVYYFLGRIRRKLNF